MKGWKTVSGENWVVLGLGEREGGKKINSYETMPREVTFRHYVIEDKIKKERRNKI